METTARRDGDDWVIDGAKRWSTGVHRASHEMVFARTSGEPGSARGLSAFRQAASSLGAAQYCIGRAVEYARERHTFGRPLASRQAIQWPLVELHTEATVLRALVRDTAAELDDCHREGRPEVSVGHHVYMCNYRANRLVCEAADRAMQVFGGLGYSRHEPFEHIYRHHRRYRITEGAEEVQIRRVAGQLFGFL